MLFWDKYRKKQEDTDEDGKMEKGEYLELWKQKLGHKVIRSNENGDIGAHCMYAKICGDKLVGIGEEQGDNVGGDIATSRDKERLIEELDRLKRAYMNYLETGRVTDESILYEQIKDYEIGDTYPEEFGNGY